MESASHAANVNTLKCPDGGSIRYRDSGSGRPIICIHGWGASSEFFVPQLDALGDDFRVVAPDLRGHGGSSPFSGPVDFGTLADDVMRLIGELGLNSPVLLGWSLGAMVAWDLLDRHPEAAVAGLVSVDMVPRLLNDDDWDYGLRRGSGPEVFERSVEAMQADWQRFTGVFVPRIFASASDPKTLIEHYRRIAEHNDPGSMARLWMCLASQDFSHRLADIDVPTLVVFGRHSRLYREEASVWLSQQIHDSRLIGFDQSGHAPHLEEPEHFNQVIRDFVRHLPQARIPTAEPAGRQSK